MATNMQDSAGLSDGVVNRAWVDWAVWLVEMFSWENRKPPALRSVYDVYWIGDSTELSSSAEGSSVSKCVTDPAGLGGSVA